ncbi:MAG: serine/threonine-protein kinase [Planctomycetota bacterium]
MNDLRDDPLLANTTEVQGYKVLPPCVVYARIGQGGMGAVYRGHHLNLDIEVAIKCLKPSLVQDDPTFIERFRREGRSAARITHQNVIRVFDVAESFGLHYLIMEYVQGETARQRVDRKGPLDVAEALQIIYEAALGLHEAHRLGIVHRDVKPDNLLISTRGQVKVADLGLAKPTLGGETSALSMAGQVMGTPPYMPPEQWNGERISGAADVWALGATLFFLLTGEEAIQGENVANIMSKIVLQPFPDVRKVRSEVTDKVAALLTKTTAKDPGERFLDGSELAEAIAELQEHRITLRDTDAGTTELRTMLSPAPMPQIEAIKEFLRENATPTPGSTPKPSDEELGATMVSKGDGGRTQGKPSKRSKLPVAIGAALAVGVGGAFAWQALTSETPKRGEPRRESPVAKDGPTPGKEGPAQVTPNPDADQPTKPSVATSDGDGSAQEVSAPDPQPPRRPDPLIELDQLETRRAFAQAFAATKRVYRDNPELEGQQARLQRLRAAATKLFNAELKRFPAGAKTEKGNAARLRGSLRDPGASDAPMVAALRIGGEAVSRRADGRFDVQRTPDSSGRIAVEVELTSGDTVQLSPWQIEFAAERPAPPAATNPATNPGAPLAFAQPPAIEPPPIDGAVTTATVTIQGRLNRPGVSLFVNGKAVDGARSTSDGSFSFDVELPNEGANRLTISAGENKAPSAAVDVVRITEAPTFTMVSPASTTLNTGDPSLAFEVEASATATAVELTPRGREAIAMERVAQTNRWRTPEPCLLKQGNNIFEVRAANQAGSTKSTLFITCKSVKPKLIGVRLNERTEPLTSGNSTVFVREIPTLRVEYGGTNAELICNGATRPTRFRLAELRERKPLNVELLVRSELGATPPWKRTFVLDQSKPTVTVSPQAPAKANTLIQLEGSVADPGGSGVANVVIERRSTRIPTTMLSGGRWVAQIKLRRRNETVTVVATDRAGNERREEFELQVDRGAAPANSAKPAPAVTSPAAKLAATIDKALFRPIGALDANGFPDQLEHRATGILLAAIGKTRKGPSLYAAVDMVTEKQWRGSGSTEALRNVTGVEVFNGLLQAGRKGLSLPTAAEWQAIAGAGRADVRRTSSGYREWLAPATTSSSNWPIAKDGNPSATARRNTSSPYRGFRVVLRLR